MKLQYHKKCHEQHPHPHPHPHILPNNLTHPNRTQVMKWYLTGSNENLALLTEEFAFSDLNYFETLRISCSISVMGYRSV